MSGAPGVFRGTDGRGPLPPRARRRALPWGAWLVAATVVAFLVGFGSAWAGFAQSPVTIHGAGNFVHGARLTFFTQAAVWTSAVPATVPGLASTTVGTPTVLPATGQSYVINAATGGHGAIQWNFTETTTPPHNTEIELTFQLTTGAAGTNSTVTIYFETQAANPATALTFLVFFDTGAGTALLSESNEVTQQCNGVGSCP